MLLGEVLHKSVIQPNLAAKTKRAAIDELIDLLIAAGDLPKTLRETARRVILAREADGGTGMNDGVALPHGTTDRIEIVVGALGISRDGIEFGSPDGQPARIIVLLLSPRDAMHSYVRDLAGIAHLLDDAAFRDTLLAAEDADQMLKRIRREEHSSGFESFLERFGWVRGRD
jgi:mannitol/fructose-specific phosphotransferase system IIA component (Ntr-type)